VERATQIALNSDGFYFSPRTICMLHRSDGDLEDMNQPREEGNKG